MKEKKKQALRPHARRSRQKLSCYLFLWVDCLAYGKVWTNIYSVTHRVSELLCFMTYFFLNQQFLLSVLVLEVFFMTDRLIGKWTKELTAFKMMNCERLIWDFSQFPRLTRLPSPLPGYHLHFGSCNDSWWLVSLNSRWWMTWRLWHATALRPALKESACAPDASPLLRWLRKREMKAGIHYVKHTHFPQRETLL